MEFSIDKIYPYTEIADIIAGYAVEASCHIIGITGTSSVGKSTLSKIIKECIEAFSSSAQVLSADDYLKNKFRGKTNFWNRLDSPYLKPEHFYWQQLGSDADALISGRVIEKECYIRGIGWGTNRLCRPTEYVIIEGLFLDSAQASEHIHYDLLISLEADDTLIRNLRIERDSYYRKTSKTFTRTESETLQEIENTLKAGKSYIISPKCKHHLRLTAKGSYNAAIQIIK